MRCRGSKGAAGQDGWLPCPPIAPHRRIEAMSTLSIKPGRGRLRVIVAGAVAWALFSGVLARSVRGDSRVESLDRPGGQSVEGRIEGDARAGFRFAPRDPAVPLPLEPGSVVHFRGAGPDALASPPPFHVLVGEALRVSGSLRGASQTAVWLQVAWQGSGLTLPRPGA